MRFLALALAPLLLFADVLGLVNSPDVSTSLAALSKKGASLAVEPARFKNSDGSLNLSLMLAYLGARGAFDTQFFSVPTLKVGFMPISYKKRELFFVCINDALFEFSPSSKISALKTQPLFYSVLLDMPNQAGLLALCNALEKYGMKVVGLARNSDELIIYLDAKNAKPKTSTLAPHLELSAANSPLISLASDVAGLKLFSRSNLPSRARLHIYDDELNELALKLKPENGELVLLELPPRARYALIDDVRGVNALAMILRALDFDEVSELINAQSDSQELGAQDVKNQNVGDDKQEY